MLTNKLFDALGLAGALMFGATTDASANPWRGPHFRPVPIYRAPVYRAPVYRAPVVYVPTYAPVSRGVGWRHSGWVRSHSYRW